jgi:ribosomal protein S3
MIEKKIIQERMKMLAVKEALISLFKGYPIIDVKVERTPLGYRAVMYSTKPSIILGRGAELLRQGTQMAQQILENENVRISVEIIENPDLDPRVVVDRVVTKLARYGFKKYKKVGSDEIERIKAAGARGAEIEIGGIIKERADHAKFRIVGGVLPKAGNVEQYGVRKAQRQLIVSRGAIGVKCIIVVNSPMPGEAIMNKEVSQNGQQQSTSSAAKQ